MWLLLTAVVGALGAAVASDRQRYQQKEALDDLFEDILFGGLPDLLEIFEYMVPSVFAVYVEGDVLLYAHYDKADAIRSAESLSEDGDFSLVDVTWLRQVPTETAEKLVAQGTENQSYSDGYEASNEAVPYIGDPPFAVVWDFDRARDMEFSLWSDDAKQQHREYIIERMAAQSPTLASGMLLYTGMAEEGLGEDPTENAAIPLTNDRAAAEQMAIRHAAFLTRALGGSHTPRVVTWQLEDSVDNLMSPKSPKELERLAMVLDADFEDLDFEDVEDMGPAIDLEWGDEHKLQGWHLQDAYGPGAHSIVLFRAPLKWIGTDPVE